MLGDNDKKWPDDAKSDILELIAQPESNVSSGGTAALDVERTMKSLDGYHEGLLEALRTAATSHRSSGNARPITSAIARLPTIARSHACHGWW